jgi:hypothetical protein
MRARLNARVFRTLAAATLLTTGTGGVIMTTASPVAAANPVSTLRISGFDLTIDYFATDGPDEVSVEVPAGDDARIVFHDANASSMTIIDNLPGTPCTLDDPTTISCPKHVVDGSGNVLKVTDVGINAQGGDDHLSASGAGMVFQSTFTPIRVTLSGGEGNDTIVSDGYSHLVGGPGDDTLTSGPGKTSGGSQFTDRVFGGAGNDTIDTATNSPDVDGIFCDDQQDVVPDPDIFLSDSLRKNTGDQVFAYFVSPNTFLPSGCDNVTTVP